MNSRIIFAALAAISIFSIAPADARQGSLGNLQAPKINVAATPAYPFPDQIRTPRGHSRAASLSRKASRTADRRSRIREAPVRASNGELPSGTIRSGKTGATAHVAPQYASAFQGYIDELEARGAVVKFMGGFRPGPCSLRHEHPCGKALDVCQLRRGVVDRRCNLPGRAQIASIAERHGLFEGGRWCSSDYGHAQVDVSAAPCGRNLYAAVGTFKAARNHHRRRYANR